MHNTIISKLVKKILFVCFNIGLSFFFVLYIFSKTEDIIKSNLIRLCDQKTLKHRVKFLSVTDWKVKYFVKIKIFAHIKFMESKECMPT